MNTRFSTTSRIVILMALLLALALPSIVAAANTVVTPANPDGWAIANKRTDANATISTTEPRGGLGSLEFVSNAVTPGSPSQDKVDFQKLWNSPAVATRTLGNLSKVSYEFYRDSSSTTASHFVPVFRLPFYHDMPPLGTVGAEDYTGYLIWEAIYNGYPAPGGVPADQWIAVDMTTQYFWMFKSSGPGGSGVVQNYGVTLSDWLNGNPQGQPGDPTVPDLDATTLIYGVNTGIGSGWGAGKQFQGFVDNVVVEFGADVVSANFEPNPLCTTVCYADDTGSDANGGTSPADAFKTIQKAIDTVQPGGVVRVLPGSYNETAVNRWVLGVNGPHQFGLFIAKNGVTLQGVTAADVAITDPNATEADITTNATNNFGTSGIFVEGDDVTIAGLEIGPNIPGENKTIEIIGDGFTLKDCLMTGDGIDGAYPYFGDWRYDTGTGVAHIESYTVTHNVFGPGSQVAVSSGAGASGPVSGRKITNNVFTMNAGQTWASISFNGNDTTVPWYTYPVGGAVITGNTFTNNAAGGQHIRVRGVMDDSEFDWASYWNNNTYNKAVVAGVNPPNDVRAWSYTTPDPYVFNGVRVIAAGIQSEIGHAQAGDTVLVKAGTYPESPNVNKSLTLKGETGRDATII
ncbi:DUF1565 domain-containing protein, partial [Promineifilum sp.]|uniref:DUF1565 domain-containing protein n=1 Tax=Promineifilum sp. TaxID=2664178 RepID=UPI0035B0D758